MRLKINEWKCYKVADIQKLSWSKKKHPRNKVNEMKQEQEKAMIKKKYFKWLQDKK